MAGVMTGERAREMDAQARTARQIRASDGVEKRDIVIPSPARPLLAEISDLFRRSPERCPKPLYETRV